MSPTSAFGDLLNTYRARKTGLTLARLANMAGYDKAIMVRMGQGQKDLTGPSGRERVVRVIAVLRDEGVLATIDEANRLLQAAGMYPLYPSYPNEAALIETLRPARGSPRVKPATNLPAQLTRFVGREREIGEVERLLFTTRLLTLTGSGGLGKTRLAMEAGWNLCKDAPERTSSRTFPDGAWLIELAPLLDAGPLTKTVAAVFGLQTMSRSALAVLTEYLLDREALLILDNCEHLVGACAELAEALLRACPRLRILATSREGLNIPGEVTWRVPPLTVHEALQLFAERASAVKPGFELTPANRDGVVQICQRLDYMPLAIELATARMDDVFRLLTGGSRTALPRHQTLRATIDWSYGLLPEAERALLRGLSVFAGCRYSRADGRWRLPRRFMAPLCWNCLTNW